MSTKAQAEKSSHKVKDDELSSEEKLCEEQNNQNDGSDLVQNVEDDEQFEFDDSLFEATEGKIRKTRAQIKKCRSR